MKSVIVSMPGREERRECEVVEPEQYHTPTYQQIPVWNFPIVVLPLSLRGGNI